jgi:very-short-patch-repair endonuclease
LARIYTKKSEQEKRRRLRKEMSKAEVLLWRELKSRKLGVRFLRQYSVKTFVVDFYCPSVRLAIEVDGATHISEEDLSYDRSRQKDIEYYGIKFLRFTNPEIYGSLESVIERIKNEIVQLQTPI